MSSNVRYIEIIRENKGALFEEEGDDSYQVATQSTTGRLAKKAAWSATTSLATKGITKLFPIVGDAIAAGDAVVSASKSYKALRQFTDLSMDVSGFKPSNPLGEWSLLEMYPDEMKKLAEGLKENMTEEDRKRLLVHYNEFVVNFKDMIVEILVALKTATVGLGAGAAIAIKVLPAETAVKELLFFMARIAKSLPDFMQEMRKLQNKVMGLTHIIPVIGFFYDADRIYEFIEIDKLITKPVKESVQASSRNEISESYSRSARKSRSRVIEII